MLRKIFSDHRASIISLSSNCRTKVYSTLGYVPAWFRTEVWYATGKDAKLKSILLKFLADESGATAIEYCLIAAAIALAIIALVNALGVNLKGHRHQQPI